MALDDMFAQILADPYDNTIRLEYAKALRDTDPAHADLIDKQVQYHLLRSVPSAFALTGPINALLAENRQRIAGELAPMCKNYVFERGFVEMLHILPPHWIMHGARIKQLTPVLDLVVRPPLVGMKEFCASPDLAGIRSLDFRSSGMTDAQVAMLVDNPHLDGLLWLNLSGNGLGQAALDAVAASDNLRSLRWLGFAGNAVDDPTPEVADDMGTVVHVHFPQSGQALQERYGPKAWLSEPIGLGRPEPTELSP